MLWLWCLSSQRSDTSQLSTVDCVGGIEIASSAHTTTTQHLTAKRVIGGRPPFAASMFPDPLPSPHVPEGLATIATRILTPTQAARAAATIPAIAEEHEDVQPHTGPVLPLPTEATPPVLPLPIGHASQAVPVLPLPGTPPNRPASFALGGESPPPVERSSSGEEQWEEPMRLRPVATVRHTDMPRLRGHPTVVQVRRACCVLVACLLRAWLTVCDDVIAPTPPGVAL